MWNSPEHRYVNDAKFKQIVDILEHLIHSAEFTPSEIREAAMLATIHHELKTVKPIIVSREDYEYFKYNHDNKTKPEEPLRSKFLKEDWES